MDNGISVLLGTITGGLISFATTFYFTNKATEISAQRLADDRKVHLQVYARLVEMELNRNLLFLDVIVETRLWPSTDALEHHQWREHRSILAAHLTNDDWDMLSVGY